MTSLTERKEISNRFKFYEAADLIEKCEQNLITTSKLETSKTTRVTRESGEIDERQDVATVAQELDELIDSFESEVASIIHPNRDHHHHHRSPAAKSSAGGDQQPQPADPPDHPGFMSPIQSVYPYLERSKPSSIPPEGSLPTGSQDSRADDAETTDGSRTPPVKSPSSRPRMESFDLKPGRSYPEPRVPFAHQHELGDDTDVDRCRHDIAPPLQSLKLENILLKNQLNLELYLKSQHLQQLGSLHKQNISSAALEAENQNLLRINKELRRKLMKTEESKERLQSSNSKNLKNKLTYQELIKTKNLSLKQENLRFLNERLDLLNQLNQLEKSFQVQTSSFHDLQIEAHNLRNELKLIQPKLETIEELEKKNESLSKALLTWDDDLRRFRESRKQIDVLRAEWKKFESLANSYEMLNQSLQNQLQIQVELNKRLELENEFLKQSGRYHNLHRSRRSTRIDSESVMTGHDGVENVQPKVHHETTLEMVDSKSGLGDRGKSPHQVERPDKKDVDEEETDVEVEKSKEREILGGDRSNSPVDMMAESSSKSQKSIEGNRSQDRGLDQDRKLRTRWSLSSPSSSVDEMLVDHRHHSKGVSHRRRSRASEIQELIRLVESYRLENSDLQRRLILLSTPAMTTTDTQATQDDPSRLVTLSPSSTSNPLSLPALPPPST